MPSGFPFEDHEQLIHRATAEQVGVIAIRVLAGGALSGSDQRHANAAQSVDPITSNVRFSEDVAFAQRFGFLVEQGHADSLVEAAIRFVVGHAGVSSTLIGISSFEQLEQAVESVEKGALSDALWDGLESVWGSR